MDVRVPLVPWWLRWSAVVGLAAFIFYVSILAVPPETIIDQAKLDFLPLDKWRHFVAYAALGYALAYATADWEIDGRLLALGVIGTIVIYGVGIEFGQSLVPERYFSIGDAYANALGGVLTVPWYVVRPSLRFVPAGAVIGSIAGRLR